MAQINFHETHGLRRWHITIPHAQVLTLQSAPLANVAWTLDASKALMVVGPIVVSADTSNGAYTANAAAVVAQLQYGGNTSFIAANSGNFTAAIGATAPFIMAAQVFGNPSANLALIAGLPLSLALINGGSNLTGGNANNKVVVEFDTMEVDATIGAN